jgi:hypothetical protein
MAQHIEQDDPVGRTVSQRTGKHESFSRPPPIAANDNGYEDAWALVPFSEGLAPISDGEWLVGPSLLCEDAVPQPPQEDFCWSWRKTFGRLAYVAAISIAMPGWLYLIWLALAYSVH